MKIEDYAEQLQQETIASADLELEDELRLETFTRLVAQRLTEAGELDDFVVGFHKARGVETSGWSFDVERSHLHLFVTDYRGSGLESLTKTQIETSLRRLETFVTRSLDHYADSLEESSPAFEIADIIRSQWKSLDGATYYVFSDGRAKDLTLPKAVVEGVPVSYQVWDLERLFRLDTSGLEREPIVADIETTYGEPIPCLPAPGSSDHQVYLLLFPAQVLADLYNEYAGRLLERNVRSFLQARGAVNKGIRETILSSPDRFLAYNNGISMTASSVGLTRNADGQNAISRIDDIQVVNGGQTTASLATAVKRDGADVSNIRVQAKLTVVSEDTIDELVAHISQYSNTQNRVTGADFSSNDPFHVKLEELSRSVWAPAQDGAQRQTHWYFERARGQYADEQARARTPAKRRQFKALNPSNQKFTKTDVAKFEHSWEQLPHTVSLGAEKNFREFMLRLQTRRVTPDEAYFRRLVSKAILFRTTERLVSAFKFGGYRANIVTYSIAKLSNETASRLDLEAVWRAQQLSSASVDALNSLIPLVTEVIFNPVGRVRHVGEWCKKQDCWAAVQEIDWDLPGSLKKELVALHSDSSKTATARDGSSPQLDLGLSTPTREENDLVANAMKVSAETWFGVSNWAKETNNLQPWQRSLAYSLGRVAANGREPSIKQSRQGLILLEEARRLGFAG